MAPDGLRAIWASLWRCIARPKVCTFVWRLVTDPLPTGVINHSRNKEVTNVCPICGTEPECSFHALCKCPHGKSLWRAMSEVWRLRRLDLMKNIGPEWLFIYSCDLAEAGRIMLYMTLWHIWHCRNEIVHGETPPCIEASQRFLISYLDSILGIVEGPLFLVLPNTRRRMW